LWRVLNVRTQLSSVCDPSALRKVLRYPRGNHKSQLKGHAIPYWKENSQ
jgi:hypothetical protein